MSTPLAVRTELTRLARVLGTDATELDGWEAVPLADLRALRDLVTDHLFDTQGERLRRVANAARILPAPVAAALAEKVIDPVMAGLMVSAVDTRKLLDMAGRLSVRYLADVCPHIDPRRIPAVIQRLPTRTVLAVAGELAERADHDSMARFVDHMDDDAILAAVAVLPDEVVVRTAPLVEATDRVDALCAALPDHRLRDLVASAVTPDLVGDALGLLAAVGPDQLRRIGTAALDAGPTVMPTIVDHAAAADLWEALLPLVPVLAPADRQRLARIPALHDPDVLAAVTHAAVGGDLWLDLLPLAPLLPAGAQGHVADALGTLDDATVARLAAEADAAGLPVPARLAAAIPA